MDGYLGMIMIWPLGWAPQGWAFCDGTLLAIQQNSALFSLLGTTYGGDGRVNFALPDLRGRVPLGMNLPANGVYPNVALGTTYGSYWSGATAKTVSPVTLTATATIAVENLPAHNHSATFLPGNGSTVNIAIPADDTGGSTNVPSASTILGKPTSGATMVKSYSTNNSDTTLAPFSVNVPASSGTVTVANTGNGVPLNVSVPLSNLSLPVKTNATSVDVSPYQPSLCLNFIICISGIYPQRP